MTAWKSVEELAGLSDAKLEKYLCDRMHDWKVLLGIYDWEISCQVVHLHEMEKEVEPNSVGCVVWQHTHRIAKILILSGMDRSAGIRRDFEHDLVHELLHIVLVPLREDWNPDGNRSAAYFEQAINIISDALITLVRSRDPDKSWPSRGAKVGTARKLIGLEEVKPVGKKKGKKVKKAEEKAKEKAKAKKK